MKHVAVCSAITLSIIVLLTSLSFAAPTPTSVLISPLCLPTPTQPSAVIIVDFQAKDPTEFITGIIVGLALTLVCVGVMRWLIRRGE